MFVSSVEIDLKSGFCFGVLFAIQMADQLLESVDYLYCLGQIVHNDEEVKRLEKKGLRIIDHDQLAELRDEKVLIRAHGEPTTTYETAFRNRIQLLDASCPVVLKLQQAIQESYAEGEQIYIYGSLGHPEISALLSQVHQRAVVFRSLSELDLDHMPSQISLFSQTTKSIKNFYSIIESLKKRGIQVKVRDSICRQVSNREKEMQNFVSRYDKVVFVAGKRSSNGRSLYESCKQVNSKTYLVSHTEEVNTEWFNEGDRVGICGATSTPQWLMETTRSHILSLKLCG